MTNPYRWTCDCGASNVEESAPEYLKPVVCAECGRTYNAYEYERKEKYYECFNEPRRQF